MKKNIAILPFIWAAGLACAQDFKTDIANAKASYAAGKLTEAHFNVQQAMAEIDLLAGKDVLKALPAKMDTLNVNATEDNVSATTGFAGASIRRAYGNYGKRAEIDIITNSPLVASISALLNSPMMGFVGNNGSSKQIMVQGYKARLEKSSGMQGQTDYTIQIPLSTTLITFKLTNSTDAEIINLAGTIPVQQIAKLLQ